MPLQSLAKTSLKLTKDHRCLCNTLVTLAKASTVSNNITGSTFVVGICRVVKLMILLTAGFEM
jgi:hypothetical protein